MGLIFDIDYSKSLYLHIIFSHRKTFFDDTDIKDFTTKGSKFMIHFYENREKSSLYIKCYFLVSQKEIDFRQCNISHFHGSNQTFHTNSIGYQFRFDRSIRYEFERHFIFFEINGDTDEFIDIRIFNMSIQFQNTKKICAIKSDKYNVIQASFDSKDLIYPCMSNGTNVSVIGHYITQNNGNSYKEIRLKWKIFWIIMTIFISVLISVKIYQLSFLQRKFFDVINSEESIQCAELNKPL
ncbi:hypothetical protein RF11_09837 [Thelohanellus kitauei]|uniref:Uncharacterized protein n=1 Tax=Thelohanellus kitauei TaxID=669202 RepID=A0A0C2MYC5_THEKT|nr:hypothetical protein RF11_09837 [Thelohanellus kitauei]